MSPTLTRFSFGCLIVACYLTWVFAIANTTTYRDNREVTIEINSNFHSWLEIESELPVRVCLSYLRAGTDTPFTMTLDHPIQRMGVTMNDNQRCYESITASRWPINGAALITVMTTPGEKQLALSLTPHPLIEYIVPGVILAFAVVIYVAAAPHIEDFVTAHTKTFKD